MVFLIILLGFVFRFYNINYENLWLDEIYSFWVTDPNLSFAETYLRIQTTESIPFLYYYLVKISNKIFGYDPMVGRCFSAFFGFLSIFSVGIWQNGQCFSDTGADGWLIDGDEGLDITIDFNFLLFDDKFVCWVV